MCLGVPGKVVEVRHSDLGIVTGKVDFAGVVKEVNLSYTPEVEPGQYVVVHVGFSISTLDEAEAQQVFRYLEEIGFLDEAEAPEHPA
jgi:hydrogenase expression/formation protein HypC